MTLKECTKEELIHIIKYISNRANPINENYYVKSALYEVEYMRTQKKLKKAEELAILSNDKREEYINLMKPYTGQKYVDIPLDVLKNGSRLIKEAHAADVEYEKIMKEVI